MSQFRQDNITKTWVLIAPKRAMRPHGLNTERAVEKDMPEVDNACVFCPGNESLNPDTILAMPSERNWRVRVIPNKFEALSHQSVKPLDRNMADFYITRPGVGDHDIVILRKHNKPVALQDTEDIELAIKAWEVRARELQEHVEIRYVHIIQNHGKLSGASIPHPHFQIFAVPFIPNHLYHELSGSAAFFRHFDRCVYCEMVERELADGRRIVLDDKDFLVFCLFASRVPFQMRILPKRHSASFTGMSVRERKSLALVLKKVLKILYDKLNDPAYNFYIHTIPMCVPEPAFCDPASYHWHLEILPRINAWAGFELGTEIYVNPVAPEDAAALLRQ